MNWEFDISRKNRTMLLKILDSFYSENLNKTPKGFSNTLIWNIAHLIINQQLLTYSLSGLQMGVSNGLEKDYNKGLFNFFKPYTTFTNSTIKNLEQALTFNVFNEGIQLGHVPVMKKSI